MTIFFSILMFYPWVLAAGLIYFLIQIARFYQKKYAELYRNVPDQQTYYSLFVVPLILFLVAAGRYLFLDDFAGDLISDIALLVGGLVLTFLGTRLHQLMTGGRK